MDERKHHLQSSARLEFPLPYNLHHREPYAWCELPLLFARTFPSLHHSQQGQHNVGDSAIRDRQNYRKPHHPCISRWEVVSNSYLKVSVLEREQIFRPSGCGTQNLLHQ